MSIPINEPVPLDCCAGHAWIAGAVQAGQRVVPMHAARRPPQAAPTGQLARLRARVQAFPVRNRPSRRATAKDPELTLTHWHTPLLPNAAASARRSDDRPVRVAMVDSAGCHPPALAAAATQVAVGHGARRRAQQHHPTSYPQPSSGYAVGRTRTRPPPCGSPIRRLGRWLDGAAGRGTAGSVAPLQAMYTSRVSSRFAGRAVTQCSSGSCSE